jgi:aminobenzoyl-glutamate utilization protein B
MLQAAKALGMTMVDLFQDPALVKKVKAEYQERKGDEVYVPNIPDGPPPLEAARKQ